MFYKNIVILIYIIVKILIYDNKYLFCLVGSLKVFMVNIENMFWNILIGNFVKIIGY